MTVITLTQILLNSDWCKEMHDITIRPNEININRANGATERSCLNKHWPRISIVKNFNLLKKTIILKCFNAHLGKCSKGKQV